MNIPLITWCAVVAIMSLLLLAPIARFNLNLLRKKSKLSGRSSQQKTKKL
jgi:uncharacterized MAPEG superfamily protein